MSDVVAREILTDTLQRMPCGAVFDFSDVVRLCAAVDLPLVEAAHVLDTLVASGALRREYVDDEGRVVDVAEVKAMLAGARWGYCPHYHVAWRRTPGRDWMLA